MTSLLKEDSSLSFSQQDSVQMIQSSSQLLRSVIDDVLDYSKLAAGRHVVDVSPVHLPNLIHNLVRTLAASPAAAKKNIRIETKIVEPNLGEWLETDERHIQQILYNIMGNAIYFHPSCVRHISYR